MLDICLNFHFLLTAMQLLHFVFNLIFVHNNLYSMMFLQCGNGSYCLSKLVLFKSNIHMLHILDHSKK